MFNVTRSILSLSLLVSLCIGNITLEPVYTAYSESLASDNMLVEDLNRSNNNINGTPTNSSNLEENLVNNNNTVLVLIKEEESDKPYDPSPLTIKSGETVRWNNDDFETHTVTSGSEKDGNIGMVFDSGEMKRGDTFTHKFDKVGSYDYFCIIHPIMTGVVIVK